MLFIAIVKIYELYHKVKLLGKKYKRLLYEEILMSKERIIMLK